MKNKTLISVLILVVVILLGSRFIKPRTTVAPGSSASNNGKPLEVDHYEESLIVDGYKSYSNYAIGLSFEYPQDWKLQLIDSGNTPPTFGAFLFPPEFFSNSSNLQILISQHFSGRAGDDPMITNAYDNLPIPEQIKALGCKKPDCEVVKNKNGVEYLRSPKVIQYDPQQGYLAWAEFPTGKHVLDFSMSFYETIEKSASIIEAFDRVVDSVQLK